MGKFRLLHLSIFFIKDVLGNRRERGVLERADMPDHSDSSAYCLLQSDLVCVRTGSV